MARAGLRDHPKFKRLVHLLGEPIPHVWGYLECLWATAYQRRSDVIGDQVDVKLNSEFPGDADRVARALVEAGFIERHGDTYYVHDLDQHAPPYVRKTLKTLCPAPQVTHQSTTDRPVVNQESNTGEVVIDHQLTTGLQGKGREGKSREIPPSARACDPTTHQPGTVQGAELARIFCASQSPAKDAEPDLAIEIAAMIVAGYDPGKIRAEIDKAKRDRSEFFWQLKRRLEREREGGRVNSKHGVGLGAGRVAVTDAVLDRPVRRFSPAAATIAGAGPAPPAEAEAGAGQNPGGP